MRRGACSAALAGGVVVGLLATGCGTDHQAADASQVSAVSTQLGRVDDALAAHRYVAARRALQSLVAETRALQKSGDLSDQEAARILTAARRLLGMLPEATPSLDLEPQSPSQTGPSERPTPTRTPTPTASATRPTTHPSHSSSPTEEPSTSPSTSPSAEPSADRSSSPSPS